MRCLPSSQKSPKTTPVTSNYTAANVFLCISLYSFILLSGYLRTVHTQVQKPFVGELYSCTPLCPNDTHWLHYPWQFPLIMRRIACVPASRSFFAFSSDKITGQRHKIRMEHKTNCAYERNFSADFFKQGQCWSLSDNFMKLSIRISSDDGLYWPAQFASVTLNLVSVQEIGIWTFVFDAIIRHSLWSYTW